MQQRSTFTTSRFTGEPSGESRTTAERVAAPRNVHTAPPAAWSSDRSPSPERPGSDRTEFARPRPAAARAQHSKRNRTPHSSAPLVASEGFTYTPRPPSSYESRPTVSAPLPSSSIDPAAYVDQTSYVDYALSEADTHPFGLPQVPQITETAPRASGKHRIPAPPVALKGRVAVLAVAAGAIVAAGQASLDGPSHPATTSQVALAAGSAPAAASLKTVAPSASQVPQILNVSNPTDLSAFSQLLAKGQKFSDDRAALETAKLRPLFVLPATGIFTSNFGTRWGTLHAGVDIANKIGTPIYAVADGVVIDSGPAAGFGMWIRLLHADGTITVYGHIDTTLVTVGEHVMAGDQIATIGDRGESTGPHLHFEVHMPGEVKIDPLPWLATRGISLGIERD